MRKHTGEGGGEGGGRVGGEHTSLRISVDKLAHDVVHFNAGYYSSVGGERVSLA